MFEVHGWAVVRSGHAEIDAEADAELLASLRAQIEQAQTWNMIVRLDVGLNGDLHVLTVTGLKNHRYPSVMDLFQWLAQNGPGSYGLLYIHDDEDHQDGDYENAFRVWRLARGRLTAFDDPFLSPCIPTLEAPYDEAEAGN